MKKIIDGYHLLLTWLMVATVTILLVPVTMQIVARFTSLIPAYIWTEEASRFLFIWMIMLGAMIGIREGTHFEVDVWPELPRRGEALVRIVARLGVLAFAIVFLVAGYQFTRFAWYRTSELADLPLWMIHIAWPTAGLTWIVFLGEQFVDEFKILFGGNA